MTMLQHEKKNKLVNMDEFCPSCPMAEGCKEQHNYISIELMNSFEEPILQSLIKFDPAELSQNVV